MLFRSGDVVEIEFINHLSQPSTVHWHGLDVPNEADGNPMDMVEPQGKKVYRFTLPQGSAGTYWYHPHPHDHVSEQVYKGLAGTFVVKAKNDPLAHLPEQHWVISDLVIKSAILSTEQTLQQPVARQRVNNRQRLRSF